MITSLRITRENSSSFTRTRSTKSFTGKKKRTLEGSAWKNQTKWQASSNWMSIKQLKTWLLMRLENSRNYKRAISLLTRWGYTCLKILKTICWTSMRNRRNRLKRHWNLIDQELPLVSVQPILWVRYKTYCPQAFNWMKILARVQKINQRPSTIF